MTPPPLFIIPSIASGGAELLLMLQLAGLRRRGVSPRLMVLSDRVDPEILSRAGMPRDHILALGLPSAVLDKTFLQGCSGTLGKAVSFAAAQRCTPIIAILPPGHFFARLMKLALLARGRRVRLIQYHHAQENIQAPRDTIAKRLFHGVNRLLSRICDHAHWHVSDQVRADVAGYMPTRRDEVIHNTCDMDSAVDTAAAAAVLQRVRRGASPFLVLLPGRLVAVKGHGLLIQAVCNLVTAEGLMPGDLQVVFAGEGPERARIATAVAESGLDDHVTFLGNIPQATLLGLYGMVDAVVMPSLSEGFGNVAIEALARRALLIASDAGGLSEIVRPGRNALQFPAGDADQLTRLLGEAYRRRGEVLIDRDAAARDARQRFGPHAHLDRLMSLLDAAAGS